MVIKMSEAHRFLSRNCPQGSLAHHPKLGLVRVIGASGFEREIQCETFDDDFHPQTISEVIHVSRLRSVDFLRDFGLAPPNQYRCQIIPIKSGKC